MKYFIVAGEASGDLHGANLMQAIKANDPNAQFNFWGGDLMQAQADGLLMHYKQTTIMGFVEVLLNLGSILRNIALCKQQIDAFKPDVVVLVDYPGFNLRIAKYCKQQGIKTVYYIAPKIWAWKESRGKLLERYVDEVLLIFPFEVEYFKKWKVKTTYVGNPLIDAIKQFETKNINVSTTSNQPVIALLPGSRLQEVNKILPIMMQLPDRFPHHHFVIAGAPGLSKNVYEPYINNKVSVVFNQTYKILSQVQAAVVCSGTATLETALFNVPQVCGYVANSISYHIAKWLIKVKYISLVNLCLNKPAITELIQHQFNITTLTEELTKILPDGKNYAALKTDYQTLANSLGNDGASNRAALVVIQMAKKWALNSYV